MGTPEALNSANLQITVTRQDVSNRLPFVIIVLGVVLFCLDPYLPLGIGNGVVCGGLIILFFLLPYRKGTWITSASCSVLTMVDVMPSPTIDGVPLWEGVTNRLVSLTAIWLPALFFLHRQKSEEMFQEAYIQLEVRV